MKTCLTVVETIVVVAGILAAIYACVWLFSFLSNPLGLR